MRALAQSALTISVAAAVLVGCGALPLSSSKGQDDTRPLIRAPGVAPQTSAVASARLAARRLSVSYKVLYRFHPPKDGSHPQGGLIDVNGTLYGTTTDGGLRHKGTVYSITTSGVQTVLYRFRGGSDGLDPQSGLVNVNGTLYGTTNAGGGTGCSYSYSLGCGTVFSVGTSGTEKVLYAFKGGSDGANPVGGLIDVNGTLYGMTPNGGGSGCYMGLGCGTVFSVTTTGHEKVLHHFAGGSDGDGPGLGAGLIDVKGVLYGTTAGGGSAGNGTVFNITTAGVEKVLYAFKGGADGRSPSAGLTNVSGSLYGTTNSGGTYSGCYDGTCGTVYRISTAGAEKVIYSFEGGTDGESPGGGLIEAGGVLYGTTFAGGISKSPCIEGSGCGTVFSVTTSGVETVLHRFAGGTDGFSTFAPVTYVNGTLYGTTYHGGDHDVCCVVYGRGTIFALTGGVR